MLHNSSRGFTLIEMLIVMAIMAGLSTVLVYNFRVSATNRAARHQVSSEVVGDIRRAQAMALSGSQYQGNIVCGFGVHYLDSQTYLIYGKLPVGNSCSALTTRNYAGGDPVVETKKIANDQFQIQSAFWDIFFAPPDPKTYINNSAVLTAPATVTNINLILKGSSSCASQTCTTITISTSGSIDVAN